MMLIRNYCLLCGNHTSYIYCSNCIQRIKPLSSHEYRCKRCSKPLNEYETDYCENCDGKIFYFDKNISLYSYREDIIKNLVRFFKFDGIKKAGVLLSEIIREEFLFNIQNIKYDLITYVPSSKENLQERGFNPLELILKKLNVKANIFLGRKKHFKKQSELSIKERENFIKGQFYLTEKVDLRNKRILIIDDIFTSGNTLNEISKILIENGALIVNTLTFFRD